MLDFFLSELQIEIIKSFLKLRNIFFYGLLIFLFFLILSDNNSLQLMPSGNVFVERLNSIKELETTMYVTNNQQAMDFIWKRESGLQVKASITDVFLVPEYVDIDHPDDNQYFLQSSFIHSEVKQTFRNILKNYCRYVLLFLY